MKLRRGPALVALLGVLATTDGRADEVEEQTDPAALFRGATEAITAGKPNEAIAKLGDSAPRV